MRIRREKHSEVSRASDFIIKPSVERQAEVWNDTHTSIFREFYEAKS